MGSHNDTWVNIYDTCVKIWKTGVNVCDNKHQYKVHSPKRDIRVTKMYY